MGWGGSINGQLGVREQEFVRSDAKNPVPLDVNKRYMRSSEIVVDFDLSADILIYFTSYIPLHILCRSEQCLLLRQWTILRAQFGLQG